MNIYFENFTFFKFVYFFLMHKKNYKNINCFYYFEINHLIEYYILPLLKLLKINIKKVNFELINVKDEYNELVRLRITRKDLFDFQKNIIESQEFKNIFLLSSYNKEMKFYIEKGLIEGYIHNKDSVARALYLINVINWHTNTFKEKKCFFIIDNRPWMNIYKLYSTKYAIELFCINNLFYEFILKINLFKYIKKFPKIYLILKNIKYRENLFTKKNKKIINNCNIFLEGRGDINLENNGSHSDFFWQFNSKIALKNIVYKYYTEKEKTYLDKYGIIAVKGSAGNKYLFNKLIENPILLQNKKNKLEFQNIESLLDVYKSNYLFWYSFFEKYKIKLFLTWNKYDSSHIIASDVIKSLGGISANWQMAFDGVKAIECFTSIDILFSHSKHSADIDKELGSNYFYNVITGYPKDYAKNILLKQSLILREKLKMCGAKNIVYVADENSVDDSRWHTGHTLQQENYSYILEEVLNNNELAVIFKPKASGSLRKRLGKVNELLIQAEKTGRCIIFENIIRDTTVTSPLLAGLSADICVCCHLSGGTVGVECALAGIPTLLIDREGCPNHKLRDLPEGKVVFNNWPETIIAIRDYFNTNKSNLEFGDWSPIINDLDPFQDGKASQRMGEYLHLILNGFEQGLNRNQVMLNAAEIYSKKWGKDKVIINDQYLV